MLVVIGYPLRERAYKIHLKDEIIVIKRKAYRANNCLISLLY